MEEISYENRSTIKKLSKFRNELATRSIFLLILISTKAHFIENLPRLTS